VLRVLKALRIYSLSLTGKNLAHGPVKRAVLVADVVADAGTRGQFLRHANVSEEEGSHEDEKETIVFHLCSLNGSYVQVVRSDDGECGLHESNEQVSNEYYSKYNKQPAKKRPHVLLR
jgi:hypothetical protein